MGRAKALLEGHDQAQNPTSAIPFSFLDMCEAIQGTLLKMSESLQMAASQVDSYIDEARRMKRGKSK